ncbi:hypothetical protein LR48_Vigan01g262700 [Vigna angularis]|uniref:Uncharacterized protein n=1 Tax=Phaseolus angularis TaxID=3914 RepID=A0A0L9TRF5_PHAAN|nr:hypothetical protein LR48_Vigan01g262700 [Vigna angularis]
MTVSIRVTVDGAGPINSGECVFGAAIRICHGQERGKVMLLENWEPTRNEGEEGDGAVDRDDLSVATNMTEPVVVSVGSCVLEWIFWASGRLSDNVSTGTMVFVLRLITAIGDIWDCSSEEGI